MEKYIGKNEAQIAINQAGPQNEEIIRQVREILVPNGFYVKSAYGLVEPKEALLRFSPGATERERYRALQERAGKRINPHCYEKELDNGGFEITEGPEILTDERECRGREGLMNLAKSPMVLGQSFDHERDRDFLDALSESLRKTEDPSTGELIYTATGRYVFLVARNRKTR